MPNESETIEQFILYYVNAGYRLIWKDMYSAQLVRPKRLRGALVAAVALFASFFSVLVLPLQNAMAVFILSVSLLDLLAFDYLNAHDTTVFLYVGGGGKVHSIVH